ncbi:hypothetical protein JTB14_030214 [Gonioctena quinquepunctata]|nr:hypothetical protein JTB14_030214 [Gonioctena quinquepunctata]
MNDVLINKKLDDGESIAFKCFLHCLFTMYDWMDEEGGFLLHEIKVTLEQADVELASLEYILYICTAIESVDSCGDHFVQKVFLEQNGRGKIIFLALPTYSA